MFRRTIRSQRAINKSGGLGGLPAFLRTNVRVSRRRFAAQSKIDPSVIWDLILSGREDRWGLTYSVGFYNVTDWRAYAPVSIEFTQAAIVQSGRTFLASANVRF